jgi:hypothetical protein
MSAKYESRLEDPGVTEQRHVPGNHVANPHGKGEDELREAEVPYLRARVDPLAGHGCDVLREVPVHFPGQLLTGTPLIGPARVQALGEGGDFRSPGIFGHRLQAPHVRIEFHLEVDPPHILPAGPVLHGAAGIHPQRGRAQYSTRERSPQQDAGSQRRHGDDVGQRHGGIGRVVRNADVVHGSLYGV